jgi:hypothetical protein
MTASVPTEYDIERFMEVVMARSPYVAKHFRFTSDIEYGVFHEGTFYGPGNKEIIFSHEEYFNPFDAVQNWRTLQPIKVLSHQISDFGLLLPDGKNSSTGQGFAAVAINLPMLLCMYRGFLMDQSAGIDSGGNSQSLLGVTHFVHMYVLPSMLYSHIDYVIMNRMYNLYHGNEMSRPTRKHAFLVVDYGDRMDNVLKEILKRLEDYKGSYFAYLQNIPSIFEEDMQVSLVMPDMPRTRQAWWALNVTRFEIMAFLIQLGGDGGVNSNTMLIHQLQRACQYLGRENMLKAILPPSLGLEVEAFLDEVLAL